MFKDRQDAGRKLASALLHYRGQEVVAIGLPRGGIPVAAEVAKALSAPMTMIFVRKIGVPTSPEVAMGAVVDGAHPYVFKNGDVIRQAGISEAVFQSAMNAELKEIERRKAIFGTVLPHIDIEGGGNGNRAIWRQAGWGCRSRFSKGGDRRFRRADCRRSDLLGAHLVVRCCRLLLPRFWAVV